MAVELTGIKDSPMAETGLPVSGGNNLVYPETLFTNTADSPGFIKFTLCEVNYDTSMDNTISGVAGSAAQGIMGVYGIGKAAASILDNNNAIDDAAKEAQNVANAGKDLLNSLLDGLDSMVKAKLTTTTTNNSVSLYMPGTIQISDSLAYETIDTKGVVDYAKQVYDQMGGVNATAETIKNALFDEKNTSAAKQILGYHLLQKRAKENGFVGNALLASGRVTNPATKLLFRSPNLRQFQVDFRFTPQSNKEATEVTKIISLFRQGAYPTLEADGALYGIPCIWRIKFGFKKQSINPFMIQFKECFLTNITTTYNPSGIPAFFKDGSPVETGLSLTFQETELNSASDIHGSGGKGSINAAGELNKAGGSLNGSGVF